MGLRSRNTKVQGRIEFERLKIWSSHTFKQPELNAKLRVTTQQEHRKKMIALMLMIFATICKTVFEAMGCYFQFCPCQEARPILTDADIKRGTKKSEMKELRKDYIREKGYSTEEL